MTIIMSLTFCVCLFPCSWINDVPTESTDDVENPPDCVTLSEEASMSVVSIHKCFCQLHVIR